MNESSPAWPIGDDAESVQAFDDAVVDGLRRLEESLWRAQTRYDSAYMNEVLAAGFVEFGRSGRVWSKADGVPMGSGEIRIRLPLPRFTVAP